MYALMPTMSGKCVQGCVKERQGERSEVTGLRGYAVTAAAVAVASVRPLRSGHCYTFEARSHSQEEEEERRRK